MKTTDKGLIVTSGQQPGANVEERRPEAFDVVVVGAGFAGMYMLYRLRGLGLTVRVLERGGDVGGTWYWNRYPGARCDIESMEYSYQFSDALQQQWEWSERYAAQPEILRYANHVADRFDLRRDIRFDTRVEAAEFDASANRWQLTTESAPTQSAGRLSAKFVVMATGCLSSTNVPDIPGLESFAGDTYHTGRWPHESINFAGKRVGVIGTGSSAIQAIPLIAEQARELVVFQRTANYSIPARNAPLDREFVAEIKSEYSEFRRLNSLQSPGFGSRIPKGGGNTLDATEEERQAEYRFRWAGGGFGFLGGYDDALVSKAANEKGAEFVRERIREIVADPGVAELLCPEQVIGCKRICLDTNYFQTYNRPNVRLVDVRTNPITAITADGLTTSTESFNLDCIVFATGFDAMTGSVLRVDIQGLGGKTLREKWAAGPRTYLGLSTAGFPNLFMISGPGSPSVLTDMIVSIEQHVNWVADCIAYVNAHELGRIDATTNAEDAWVDHVNALAEQTLYPTCNSWYLGANIPGKPRVFMPHLGFPPYVEKCEQVAAAGYEGFALS